MGRAKPVDRASLEQHRRFGYRPELDGVRALAILPVVTYHAWTQPEGGFLGVDVFFCLSGFLITTLLVQEWQSSGRISLPHFYLRRALRLLPALLVAVTTYAIYSLVVDATGTPSDSPPLRQALEGALYGISYISNLMIVVGQNVPVSIGHLWSLATEEQFYLAWPVTLAAVFSLRNSRRLLNLGLPLVIALVCADRSWLLASGASFKRVYFAPDGHFDVILIGCLAGWWYANDRIPSFLRSPPVLQATTPIAVSMIIVMFLLPAWTRYHVYLGLLPLLAAPVALLILAVLTVPDAPLAVVLRLPPLVFVGKISYALYLWHPILIFGFDRLPRLAEVALSFAAATLSYYLVELPFLRRKRRDRVLIDERSIGRQPRPATATARA